MDRPGAFNGVGLGQSLRINGYEYTVIGVIEASDPEGGPTSYSDNQVYIPYTNATRLNGNAIISSYLFSATSDQANNAAKAAIEAGWSSCWAATTITWWSP